MDEYALPEEVHRAIGLLDEWTDKTDHVMEELDIYSCPIDHLIEMDMI